MTIHVKICGITEIGAALAAVEAGADAIGFVFSESVRRISPDKASSIAAAAGDVEKVAVFRDATEAEIRRVLDVFPADCIQANHLSLVGLGGLPAAIPVFRERVDTLEQVRIRLGEWNRRFLYEGEESGIGKTVDWATARRVAAIGGDMSLAGGLTPDNVADAIGAVRPFGVDVSSGVESSPAIKDPTLIRRFVDSARSVQLEEQTA